MRNIFSGGLAAALVILAGAAGAERADREKEIVVGADHLTADDANHTSTFEGSVVVTQGTMRITASKVTVKEDAERHKYYVASGAPVTFRQKRDRVDEWVEGFAERAEFDDRNDVLRLFKRARVKSNQNEIAGDFISYDMRRDLAEVSGAPPGSVAPNASRVKVIILPPKKASEDEPTQSPPPPSLKLKTDAGNR
ncbi:MAG TPA: lipopolysaccharide transport periplasmic protein LptA [Usitatibacter sp.]|nr:lipopolysaccharide transport periplasmic protein LptA [Usitatibacter sp.]